MAWRFEIAPVFNDTMADKNIAMMPDKNVGYGEDFLSLFEYVGMPYKKKSRNSWVSVDPFETKMIIEDKKIARSAVPDVRGMGARDAMYVLENLGLRVSVFGRGKVARQSLLPGTGIKGQQIEIYLQ